MIQKANVLHNSGMVGAQIGRTFWKVNNHTHVFIFNTLSVNLCLLKS